MNTEQRPTPEARGPFKSMDPIWPKWGVTPAGWNKWKADAEKYMKTGIIRGSVDRNIKAL